MRKSYEQKKAAEDRAKVVSAGLPELREGIYKNMPISKIVRDAKKNMKSMDTSINDAININVEINKRREASYKSLFKNILTSLMATKPGAVFCSSLDSAKFGYISPRKENNGTENESRVYGLNDLIEKLDDNKYNIHNDEDVNKDSGNTKSMQEHFVGDMNSIFSNIYNTFFVGSKIAMWGQEAHIYFNEQYTFACRKRPSLSIAKIFAPKLVTMSSNCNTILNAVALILKELNYLCDAIQEISSKLKSGDYTSARSGISSTFANDVREALKEANDEDKTVALDALSCFDQRLLHMCIVAPTKYFWIGERIVYQDGRNKVYGTIVEYIKNFKDEDHTYDLEDEYYGLCKILPDGAIANDNNYTYLDLWTPLTCFEATTQVDIDDEYVLLYGVDWLFANDNNHVLENKKRGKANLAKDRFQYVNYKTILEKADNVLVGLLPKFTGTVTDDEMVQGNKLKLFNVEMKYHESKDMDIIDEKTINDSTLGESPFVMNKIADKIYQESYSALNAAEKILVLSWLCDTLLNSNKFEKE